MHLKITLSVDDVNPSPQYRILGTPVEKWMQKLHDDFGVKFDLFVTANWHKEYPISKHKEWFNELRNIPYFSINAHGMYHQCKNANMFGEAEFYELNTHDAVLERLTLMYDEWNELDYNPLGWRSPGWLTSEATARQICQYFHFAAIHTEHSRGLYWERCENFNIVMGHDGIHSDTISVHNDNMIMFQSHIAGNHNDNVWNNDNFNRIYSSLSYLTENHTCDFKFIHECV